MDKSDTKSAIAKTAFELFRKNSYDKVTINDICAACGLSKNTFYYYYKSKEELLLTMYSSMNTFDLGRMSEVFSGESYLGQLWMLDEPLADFAIFTGAPLIRHWLTNSLSMRPEHSISPMDGDMVKLSASIIQKAQRAGEIKNTISPELLVEAKNRLIMGSIFIWAMRDGDFDLKEDLRHQLCALLGCDISRLTAHSTLAE